MKEIEKLFEEKLKTHQVMPPVEGWEKLNRQLQAKRRRKLFVYWKIAASVCLLMAATAWVYFIQKDTATKSTEISSVAVQPVSPDIAGEDKPTTESDDTESHKQVAVLENQQPEHMENDKPKANGKTVKKPVRKVGKHTVPNHGLLAHVVKVDARGPQALEINEKSGEALQVQVDKLASNDTYEPVTIIYKTDHPEEKSGSLEKTFAFLSHLKSNAIGFGELRQAKDELITKAFSSKEKGPSGE